MSLVENTKERIVELQRKNRVLNERVETTKFYPKKKKKQKIQKKHFTKKIEPKNKYQLYLKSPQWFLIRNWLFYFRGEKCQECGSTKDLQVHHLNYYHIFNEMPDDLKIVCKQCHELIHLT
jgi:5-methylcytosine-specific restriction endonuclease McrA